MKAILNIKFLIFAMSTLVLATGCNSEGPKKEGAKYEVTSPLKGDQNLIREYVAQIRAIQHIDVRAFERGYLQKVFVDEGQLIQKNQKMFEIMPTINQAEYKKSKAEMDLAEIEYKNTQILANKNVVSKNEEALAKAKFQRAKADQDLKKIHLDFTIVKAPFSGIMDRFQVRLGSLVDEGQLLTTLSDNSKMWVYFNVSEVDYLNLKSEKGEVQDLAIQLKMANGQIFAQDGKIDTAEADFNNETGNIAFRASFPNPDGLLRHGETGNILITVPLKDVLVIPQKATFDVLDKKFVYLVESNNKLTTQEITIQGELPHLFIISKGLAEKDHVLIDGITKVAPGQKIIPNFVELSKILSKLNDPAQ